MFGSEKFRNWLQHPGLNKKDSDPPDYGPMAAANEKAAAIAKESADADLAFRKQVYEESKPQYQRLLDLADQTTRQQTGLAEKQQQVADEQYKYWQDTYRPTEFQTVLDAYGANYLSEDDRRQLIGALSGGEGSAEKIAGLTYRAADAAAEKAQTRAAADINSAFSQQARTLMRLGGDPNKIAAYATQLANQQALARVTAANQARESALGQGVSLRSGVANFGRNMPNTAGQATGLAMQAGSQAVGNQNAAFGAGVTYPSYVSGGVGNQLQAQGLSVQGNNALIGAMSNDYAAGSRNDGLDIGGLLSGGAALFKAFRSDRRLKEDIVPVGEDRSTGLTLYEFSYVGLPGRRFRGVLADEVERRYPDAVSYDDLGFASVSYDVLGIPFAEVSDAH